MMSERGSGATSPVRGESSGVKRPRLSKTCHACRTSKLKCDKVKPVCGRCAREGLQCVYEDGTAEQRAFRFVPSDLSAEVTGEGSSRQPLAATGQGSGPRGLEPGEPRASEQQLNRTVSATVAVSEERLQSMEMLLQSLNTKVESIRAQAASEKRASSADTVLEGMQSLSLHEGHYVDDSFWARICDEAGELNALLSSMKHSTQQFKPAVDLDEGDLLSAAPKWSNVPQHLRTIYTFSNGVVQLLMSKEQSDMLVDAFIEWYQPIITLVHGPSFKARYEYFWVAQQHTIQNTEDYGFLALFTSALFGGALVCTHEELANTLPISDSNELAMIFRKDAIRMLRRAKFPALPSLDTIAAYSICQTSWMRTEEPLSCCGYVGVCIRLATILGLHKDPASFRGIDSIEMETRRRLWWHIVDIDAQIALAAGVPTMIDDRSNISEVSELKEGIIGTPQGMEYEDSVRLGIRARERADDSLRGGRTLVSMSGIRLRAKYFESATIHRVMHRLRTGASQKDIKWTLDQFKALETALKGSFQRLPELPRDDPDPPSSISLSVQNGRIYLQWLKLYMPMISHRVWSQFPQLVAQVSSSTWADGSIYQQIIEHTESYVQLFVYLSCADERFERFHWSWPGINQPLSATSILLKCLIAYPHSDRAERQRELIDQIFALCGPDGGVIGGGPVLTANRPLAEGANAWKLLRALKRQAWQKAELSDDSLWSRAYAVEFARARYKAGASLGFEAHGEGTVDWLLGVPDIHFNFPDPAYAEGAEHFTDTDWQNMLHGAQVP